MLTVTGMHPTRHRNGEIQWECKCDCGNPNIILSRRGPLQQGYKTSCGCKKMVKQCGKPALNRIDMTGQRYGSLTVIEPIEGSAPLKWRCICDCGTEVIRAGRSLRTGKSLSCGCRKKEIRKNLVGKCFGKLTVIDRAENYISPRGQNLIQYLCKCDCGREVVVHAGSLIDGLTKSCGCIRSYAEMRASKYFTEHNISFVKEYRIPECRNCLPLPFDFAVFDINGSLQFLLELQGSQHYEPRFDIAGKGSVLERTQHNDAIKDAYCKQANIRLEKIAYTDFQILEQKLEELTYGLV